MEGIRLTGYLDEGSLLATVQGADFLVFPSIYEGFGLPVLEAMTSGVPVLSSNRGSLLEVGGGAALYFDPESTEEIAAGLRKIGGDADLRNRLRALGLAQARSFSWEKTARETLAVYRSVLERENERA